MQNNSNKIREGNWTAEQAVYFLPTTVKCTLCGDGVMVPKKGRFGPLWKCNAEVSPRCKFYTETKPNGAKCKMCKSLVVAGTKTIPDRCSNKLCLFRNPHKL